MEAKSYYLTRRRATVFAYMLDIETELALADGEENSEGDD